MQLDKRIRSWGLPAAIAVAVVLWLFSGSPEEETTLPDTSALTAAETASDSVRVRTQSAESVTRTIVINGRTEAARSVTLAAETDGRIVSIAADRGANVASGELLIELDMRDREARLAMAEAMVRQREVENEARQSLKGESFVSEAQLAESEANLAAARAELERARLDLEFRQVRAPFDGALLERSVEVGDFVAVGDPIATFVDNRELVVSADLSEFDAAYVETGQVAEATLATGETLSGTIRYVAPVANESTRTFLVEMIVDNSDGSLRAGGTAELRLPAEKIEAHRVSPALLTLDDAGTVGVKIVDEDGIVRFAPADIALTTTEGVWIAGLPETTTFITVGQGYVDSGSTVNPVPEDDIPTALAVRDEDED